MSKIGILGGTFNPIHKGHTELASLCADKLGFDRVILIPDYTPPHKSDTNLADCNHRLTMCRLAAEELNGFEVSDIEIRRGGKSYTYQTLTELKRLYPEDELYFITGADMFLTLDTWKKPEIIFQKSIIAAVPRDESDWSRLSEFYNSVLKPLGARAEIINEGVIQISSTFIRQNIGIPQLVSNYLNQNVYSYIINNKLYGT